MALQADVESGTPMQSATLLQDTVDQFEKVVDLERVLLRKSILKLGNDLEEACTELGMKEEELMVWEQRIVQIQQDNEVKLRLAKSRLAGRQKGEGRSLAGSKGPVLSFIAEGDEDDMLDLDEEEVDAEDISPMATDASLSNFGVLDPRMEAVQAVNALADIIASELAVLRKQCQEMVSVSERFPPAVGREDADAPRTQVPAVSTLPGALLSVEQRIDRLKQEFKEETAHIIQAQPGSYQPLEMPRFSQVHSRNSSISSRGLPLTSSSTAGPEHSLAVPEGVTTSETWPSAVSGFASTPTTSSHAGYGAARGSPGGYQVASPATTPVLPSAATTPTMTPKGGNMAYYNSAMRTNPAASPSPGPKRVVPTSVANNTQGTQPGVSRYSRQVPVAMTSTPTKQPAVSVITRRSDWRVGV
mmetsp:Transcript_64057/g.118001  ORF Transcript_64057/g.118001 Transcript_64057/m.118001 type:complete len:416 (+) Transcript_64057:92-1339(+)